MIAASRLAKHRVLLLAIVVLVAASTRAQGPAEATRTVHSDEDEPFVGPPFPPDAAPLAEWVDGRALNAPDPGFREVAAKVVAGLASKPMLRAFYEAYQLHFPFEKPVPSDWRQRAEASVRANEARLGAAFTARLQAATWSLVGPTNVGGRVSAIAIDPLDPNHAYVGAADGGVWDMRFNTTTNTAGWTPLFDAQPTLSIGAIAIDPGNPRKIFVGTGEQNFAVDNYYGLGLVISMDGGATWGAPIAVGSATRFGAIEVRPDNSQIVFAAASDGLYRSSDGGLTWTRVLSGGTATDLAINPVNPDVVYVAMRGTPSGIWKSTTGGGSGSFTQLTGTGACTLPVAPTLANSARIALAMARSNPSVLYAGLDIGQGQVWKSTDAGATWCQVTTPGTYCNAQCWYDIAIAVDPVDPNHVLAAGLNAYRSTDGGTTWTQLNNIHTDHHVLKFATSGPKMALNGNDGSLYRFEFGATVTVRNLEANFATTQYYGMGFDPTSSTYVYGGSQDNGTQRLTAPSTTGAGVALVSCGDGAAIRVNPVMGNRIYVTACPINATLRFGVSDNRGGATNSRVNGITTSESANWATPIEVHDASTIYTATSNRVYVCRNADALPDSLITWTPMGAADLTPSGSITTIASTPADAMTVWAGTSVGGVWITTDGTNWTERWRASGGRSRYVGKVAASRTDANAAWIALGGMGGAFDSGGHVFETTNGGLTWSDMSGDLPNVPVNSIAPDPGRPDHFWAGSWVGIFKTENHGVNWVRQTTAPNVSVAEMAYDPVNGLVYAATHGRGIWKADVGAAAGPPLPVPDGSTDKGPAMTAVKRGADVQVTWGAVACTGNADYHLFHAVLANKATFAYAGAACGLGTGGAATFTPPSGSIYWLMAGQNLTGSESGHRRGDFGVGWLPATGAGLCPAVTGRDTSQSCP